MNAGKFWLVRRRVDEPTVGARVDHFPCYRARCDGRKRIVRIGTMSATTFRPVLLFSYGTLRDPAVQRTTFGRTLKGRADSLPGYTQSMIAIEDSAVLATSGRSHHPIVHRSCDRNDCVPGIVFEITAEELAAADRYEVAAYERVSVTLTSGITAWVYVRR